MPLTSSEAALRDAVFDFVLSVDRIGQMEGLASAVMIAVAPLKITAAASGLVSGPKAASSEPFHFANWPQDWIALYFAEEYLLADPIPRWARSSGRPVCWSELIPLLPKRDHGRVVIEAANRYGFTEGIAVPMRAADNSLGAVSFGGNRGAFSPFEKTYLTLIARAAFEAADRIENPIEMGKAAPILTAREIECLALMARGHSDLELSRLLGMSIRTVRFHLGNARTKFSASSRTQLAALAVAQGYVNL